jgi:DHA1 family bicyclomycin/chloramphenicol resistance-like MFS transporter
MSQQDYIPKMKNQLSTIMVFGMVMMLAPFAIDLYLPAFPTIAEDLATGIDQLEATVAIFLMAFAGGQLVLGPLSDVYGRRRILIFGLILFVFASTVISVSNSLNALFFLRFWQGIGAAGTVTVFPMVQDRFSKEDAARAISIIMALIVVAPMIAPLVGGYVLIFAGWRALFIVLSLIGFASLLLTLIVLRPSRRKRRLVSLADLRRGYATVFAERRLMLAVTTGSLALAGLFAFVAGSPFVYITYFGVAPERYGLLIGMNAATMIAVNLANASFLARVSPIRKIVTGAFILAVSSVAMLASAVMDQGLLSLILAALVFFAALALVETNAAIVAFSLLPEENGTVAALNGAFQFGFGALSSLLVSVTASTNAVPLTAIMALSGVAVVISATLLRRYR